MLGLIRVGAIQAVFIQRLDRLSRKVADSAKLLHQFKKHGVRLEYRDSPGGHEWKVWRHLLADFLRHEAQRMITIVGRGGVGKTALFFTDSFKLSALMVCVVIESAPLSDVPHSAQNMAPVILL